MTTPMTDMACAIMRRIRALNYAPRHISSHDAILMPGPPNGDMWRIRMYRNGRGVFHINVKIPGSVIPKYSEGAVLEALREFGINVPEEVGEDPPLTDDEEDMEGEEMIQDQVAEEQMIEDEMTEVVAPLLHRAAYRIQVTYRAYLMWKNCAHMRRLEAERDRIQREMETAQKLSEVRLARLYTIAHMENAFQNNHPGVVLLPVVRHVHGRTLPIFDAPTNDFMEIMINPSDLDRGTVNTHAETLVRTCASNIPRHKYGRAHLHLYDHAPLIIGDLPILSSTFISCDLLGVKTYISLANTPSEEWLRVTSMKLDVSWANHMRTNSRTDITFVTVYADMHARKILGAMAVSKKLVRLVSYFYPAVSIESIVASETESGVGKRMIELVRMILFSDVVGISFGLMFGQCVRIPFWGDRMDQTREAQSLVLQMTMIYESYTLERNCLARSAWITKFDDMPSPARVP